MTPFESDSILYVQRYVDGLGTNPPTQKADYVPMGKRLARKGYKYPPFFILPFVKEVITAPALSGILLFSA